MATSGKTSGTNDKEWYNEWERLTKNDNPCQRMTASENAKIENFKMKKKANLVPEWILFNFTQYITTIRKQPFADIFRKQVLLKTLQFSQENTYAGVFFNKVADLENTIGACFCTL